MPDWMLYGATGYTGPLVAEEAVKRGHKPLLAGRSEGKLKPLADRLGLEYVAVSLDDADALARAVGRVKLVYHAAGPFIHTSEPMLRACLAAGAHYLDITGEVHVIQNAFRYSDAAREKGIAIIPGVGFDLIPSDCLLKYVADQLPGATHLEVVLEALSTTHQVNISAGTAKSAIGSIPGMGNLVRRDGELVPIPFGSGARQFRFPDGEHWAMPIPWSDIEMGYHTTGIPNITAYLTFPLATIRAVRLFGGLMRFMLRSRFVRKGLSSLVERLLPGPSESTRQTGRSYLYARVDNSHGESRQAWLEAPEAYQFTALVAPLVVERVLDGTVKGATTPALAFGADFVLYIPGTRRWDTLP
jgi:short subunit dehydrogenase-like uncharacterized protein